MLFWLNVFLKQQQVSIIHNLVVTNLQIIIHELILMLQK